MLRIQNENEFDQFNFKYGYMVETENFTEITWMHIKWIDVEENFGGIEIIPFLENRSMFPSNELKEKYKKHGFVFGNSNLSVFW